MELIMPNLIEIQLLEKEGYWFWGVFPTDNPADDIVGEIPELEDALAEVFNAVSGLKND